MNQSNHIPLFPPPLPPAPLVDPLRSAPSQVQPSRSSPPRALSHQNSLAASIWSPNNVGSSSPRGAWPGSKVDARSRERTTQAQTQWLNSMLPSTKNVSWRAKTGFERDEKMGDASEPSSPLDSTGQSKTMGAIGEGRARTKSFETPQATPNSNPRTPALTLDLSPLTISPWMSKDIYSTPSHGSPSESPSLQTPPDSANPLRIFPTAANDLDDAYARQSPTRTSLRSFLFQSPTAPTTLSPYSIHDGDSSRYHEQHLAMNRKMKENNAFGNPQYNYAPPQRTMPGAYQDHNDVFRSTPVTYPRSPGHLLEDPFTSWARLNHNMNSKPYNRSVDHLQEGWTVPAKENALDPRFRSEHPSHDQSYAASHHYSRAALESHPSTAHAVQSRDRSPHTAVYDHLLYESRLQHQPSHPPPSESYNPHATAYNPNFIAPSTHPNSFMNSNPSSQAPPVPFPPPLYNEPLQHQHQRSTDARPAVPLSTRPLTAAASAPAAPTNTIPFHYSQPQPRHQPVAPPSASASRQVTPPPESYNPNESINFLHLLHPSSSPPYELFVSRIVHSSDQQASVFLQQKLKVATPEARTKIVDAIVGKGFEMMTHRFGNWAVQRCLESPCTREDRAILAQVMKGRVVELATNCYGTHVIQKALDCEESIKLLILSELLLGDPYMTLMNKHAAHVWSRIMEIGWADPVPPIFQCVNVALKGKWVELACHETGSLVVQHAFENLEEEDTRDLIEEVIQGFDRVVRDAWGSWVIQHLLEHGLPQDKARALDVLIACLHQYGTDQQANKSVEKALKCGGPEVLDTVVKRLSESGNSKRRAMIVDLALNTTGSQLVAQILPMINKEQGMLLYDSIKKHVVTLKGSKAGSRVTWLFDKMRGFHGY